MLWLLIPFGAALFYSLRMFIENYLTDRYFKREKVSPDVLVIPGCISLILVLICFTIYFGPQIFTTADWQSILLLAAGGVVNILAFVPYYKSYKTEEPTGVIIMTQMAPILSLGMAAVFLGEVINFSQGVSFFMIFGAILLLIFEKSTRKKRKMELKTAALMFIACLCWVLADILYAPAARELGLEASYVWFLLGELVMVFILSLIMKSWRQNLAKFLHRKKSQKLLIITVGEIIYAVAEVLFHAGLIILPVAIMTVLEHIFGLILVFILGIVFTIFYPKFAHEKLAKRTIVHHLIALILVALGIILLNSSQQLL
ncbi:MAG: DMT family transporter [Candidatus Nomurabacteria bacterium]|jgi:drug/metabolite transporter (DMT)-like permease|nr:DMT family transporter [Candidatus Nomurabacteria bacterium]